MDFVNGVDTNTITFWNPNNCDIYDLMNLTSKSSFTHKSLEDHKKEALEKAKSFPLIFLEPELFYKESKRPVTNMSLFKQSVQIIGQYRIPVTRYATSMSGRLYNTHNSSSSRFIGTFYYYEKESTTFLSYNTSRTFTNKYDCLINLDTNKKYNYLRVYMAFYQKIY